MTASLQTRLLLPSGPRRDGRCRRRAGGPAGHAAGFTRLQEFERARATRPRRRAALRSWPRRSAGPVLRAAGARRRPRVLAPDARAARDRRGQGRAASRRPARRCRRPSASRPGASGGTLAMEVTLKRGATARAASSLALPAAEAPPLRLADGRDARAVRGDVSEPRAQTARRGDSLIAVDRRLQLTTGLRRDVRAGRDVGDRAKQRSASRGAARGDPRAGARPTRHARRAARQPRSGGARARLQRDGRRPRAPAPAAAAAAARRRARTAHAADRAAVPPGDRHRRSGARSRRRPCATCTKTSGTSGRWSTTCRTSRWPRPASCACRLRTTPRRIWSARR